MKDFDAGFNAGLQKAQEIAEDLELRWRKSATDIRAEGTWNTGWPFYKNFVSKKWDQEAETVEAAADGIKRIREVIELHKAK